MGLAPSSVLQNITLTQEGENGNLSNTTILDVLGPQEIEEVTNMTPTTTEGGEPLDLDEVDMATANETDDEGVEDEGEVSPPSTTNETSAENATSGGTGTTEVEDEGEVSPPSTTNETSAENATSGGTGTTEVEDEGEVSPPSTTNETSAENATNDSTGKAEVEEEKVTEEDEESPSQTGTPPIDQEMASLDNKSTDLDLNQTEGILSENITNLNNTSVLPTSEDSEESNNEDSEESNNEDNEESSDEERDEND